MRIRLTGTQAECDRFTTELIAATPAGVVREVSGFYPNRGNSLLGRVYLDLELPPADPAPLTRTASQSAAAGSAAVRVARSGRRTGRRGDGRRKGAR